MVRTGAGSAQKHLDMYCYCEIVRVEGFCVEIVTFCFKLCDAMILESRGAC